MKGILFSFVGDADLKGAGLFPVKRVHIPPGVGPLARIALSEEHQWVSLHLFDDRRGETKGLPARYAGWLDEQFGRTGRARPDIQVHGCAVDDPTDFAAIYESVIAILDKAEPSKDIGRVFNLSSGTSMMTVVLVMLSQTRTYRATLVQSSEEKGVQRVDLPARIVHDFLRPRNVSPVLMQLGQVPLLPAFFMQSRAMQTAMAVARQVANRNVSVLIQGETGTGKEEVAFHLHLWRMGVDVANAQQVKQARSSFKAVNCSAIPENLLESELFGVAGGAFTDAKRDRPGLLLAAGTGTVMLDEIGDMPLAMQAKLLRVLQERRVTPVGATEDKPLRARIVAATHRDLPEEVAEGRFREDLYYRLAEVTVVVPPLRSREDRVELAEALLKQFGREDAELAAELDDSARVFIANYPWPGNVRQLMHTLKGAALFASRTISAADLECRIPPALSGSKGLLNLALPLQFQTLNDLHAELDRHYLRRALDTARGVKAQAARLLGLASAVTFRNRWTAAFSRQNGE